MTEDSRRALSLASLLVLVIAVIALTAWSVSGWVSTQDRIAVAERDAELPPAADPQRYLLTAASRAQARADLQTRLNEMARQNGVTLSRFDTEPANPDDALRMLSEVEVSGSIGEISAFLHAVESTTPALIVTEAGLRPARTEGQLRLTASIEARLSPGAAE
ncbi:MULTISPECIES: GspMb/PilO family protein [Hyphobacterium]|uniref:GspMb/PilO family protein n=1 Tax=Hyphobacterium vulgare TaxID=1736751 RepID=A0ABV6ZVD4_9PROT